MSEPVSLAERRAEKEDDATLWSPEDALAAAIRHRKDGEWKGTKILIVNLDDVGKDDYNTSWRQAGMSCSEMIGLLSRLQYEMNRMMGG